MLETRSYNGRTKSMKHNCESWNNFFFSLKITQTIYLLNKNA